MSPARTLPAPHEGRSARSNARTGLHDPLQARDVVQVFDAKGGTVRQYRLPWTAGMNENMPLV
jgi:hypothetical protein